MTNNTFSLVRALTLLKLNANELKISSISFSDIGFYNDPAGEFLNSLVDLQNIGSAYISDFTLTDSILTKGNFFMASSSTTI